VHEDDGVPGGSEFGQLGEESLIPAGAHGVSAVFY
jgi:hypothetical protein